MRKKIIKLSQVAALAMTLVATLFVHALAPASAQDADATEEPVEVDEYWDVEPMLMTAFFGLDNEIIRLPPNVCRRSQGQDGIPVIFSHPIDAETLDSEDFSVTSAEGTVSTPICAVLQPAVDDGENRTALLIGEFGTAPDDEPVEVEIVGELLSLSETGAVDFNGTSVDVIPLVDGPEIITAELLPESLWILDREGQRAVGSGCPSEGTQQVVRVRWTGGIAKPDDEEVDDVERELYTVVVEAEDGSTEEVVPFALGNLDDNDNNHDLCLDVEGLPVSVSFPAGHVIDPNADLNPATGAEITVLPGQTPDPTQTPQPDDGEMSDEPMLLSAFFGLDNETMPVPPNICRGGRPGQDGMPVIFSHPIDMDTVDLEDFEVTSADGMISTPICTVQQPAVDDGENRTIVLVGEFGTAPDNEPVEVEVVGEVLSSPETGAIDFNGTSVDVIPLVDGPEIITAELLPESLWILDREGDLAVGSGCPSEGTQQVVRVRWTGGITKPGDEEVDDLEREQYMVTIEAEDGSTDEVVPFALGNLDDGDNLHDLCLDVEGLPVSVSFPAGFVTDPGDDLNPETGAEVTILP